MTRAAVPVLLALAVFMSTGAAVASPDPEQDILVTFRNDGASAIGGAIRTPYRARKRYSISTDARRDALAIAREYSLEQVDHWPIRSLGVYCFVYRVPAGSNRQSLIDRLQADARVESVQPLQEFETGTGTLARYNDTYFDLQHGLDLLSVGQAHQVSRGQGIRIAIIDSSVDLNHEDLRGRIRSVKSFIPRDRREDTQHGTAVVSVIVANANNAAGIVGVAPEAEIDLLVSCWSSGHRDGAVCDSFSLAKALDALAGNPPQILNMSISGPDDSLLGRLIDALLARGVVVVAADTAGPGEAPGFPASRRGVISAANAHLFVDADAVPARSVFAPGDQIMVAVPSDAYDFRSGSSLAAAHISGVVALLLASSPSETPAKVMELLRKSQASSEAGLFSVDACRALSLASGVTVCGLPAVLADSLPQN